MKPATYDGSISWTNYKAHFEACAQLNQWTEEQKGLYLSVSLRGQAQGVFGNLNAKTTDYKELVRALEDRFSPPNQTELYRVQLRDRHQKATESMAELGQDIRRLTNLAYPNAPSDVKETLAKEQFMDALSNSDMRLRIKQARPSDLNDAVRHAVELEAFYRAEKRHQGQVRTTSTDQSAQAEAITSLQKTVEKLEKMVQDLSKQRFVQPNLLAENKRERGFNRENQRSQGYSYSRDFRNNNTRNQSYAPADKPKRACYECGSESHFKRDCPSLKADSSKKSQGKQSEENHNKIQTSGISASGLYVTAKIDRINADCLVDTGATLTIVSSKVWEVINDKKALTQFDTPLVSATGDTMKVKGRTELSMTFGDSQYTVPVIIADMDIDVVLGIDFMQEQDVSVNVAHRKMIIGKQEFPLQCSGKIGCYRVVLTDKVEIPAGSEIITQGKVNEASISRIGLGLVEPSETSIIDGKGFVARALVKADGIIPLRIANFSVDTQTLYPGTDIARISKVQGIQKIDKQNQPESNVPSHLKELYERATVGMVKKEKKEVMKLLSKYSHIFSETDSDLGRSGIIKHQIPTGEARPIKQPMRRIPVHLRDEVDQQIDTMLNENIIKPSTSPWASGIVIVKKKDGTSRFCVDYRQLNDVTIKDAYPLPRIDESLDQLAGSKWFSCLDLSSGFWQVEMDENDKQKTAFTTRRGLFEFNVMPFGLSCAPATFERLMEVVLAGLHWKICLIYLDDIIVIGKTFEDMINNLECVFKRFEESGLKLKPRKCQLFKREVEFLGHVVNESGVGTDPKKIECIEKWPTPTSVTEVRSFLGLCSYYRRFIADYSKIAKPLHCLTEKSRKFEWTMECENAFSTLKQMLITAPMLSHPDFSLPFILDTDASDFAIGAVLSQNINGTEKVVAYASRTLSKSERSYCVTRKEMLALVYFTKYFKHYLYGRKFTARTDHGSLRWLSKFKNPEGQVARWLELLSSYDMVIEHRRGSLHNNADSLSRIPCRQCGLSNAEKIKDMKTEEEYLSIRRIASLNIDDPETENMKILQEEDRDLR
ncbi:MAG: RNase H-like domain-containing protein, partial [Candidatus Thiodiazotropha endolucinida]|nr:retroviral-like aspartic protease family protein [Candidatus Thiodiazotropha taylori]MCW4345710.1 RNase H-like domain-containing protein [Candidatus Thiodiazotropha endolucinida]